jgi:uncharacterized membrane protein
MGEIILLLLIWFVVSLPVAALVAAIFRIGAGGFEIEESEGIDNVTTIGSTD